jgi:hypothetical protein
LVGDGVIGLFVAGNNGAGVIGVEGDGVIGVLVIGGGIGDDVIRLLDVGVKVVGGGELGFFVVGCAVIVGEALGLAVISLTQAFLFHDIKQHLEWSGKKSA